MTLDRSVDLIWTLSVLACGAVLWRLRRERMLQGFPMLTAFLLWDIGLFAVFRFLPPHKDAYAQVFFGTRVVTWIVSVLVALELVNLITKHYPGIATLARWLIRGSLALALGLALLSATFDVDRSASSRFFSTFRVVDRTVSVSVVCFILATVLFLLWFPVRLSKNVVAYALAFVAMYSARVTFLLLMTAPGAPLMWINLLEMLVALCVYTYWFAVLRHRHESGRVVVGHAWNRTAERKLIQQLESINATVLRATKQSEP